jgi:hypothetical protein
MKPKLKVTQIRSGAGREPNQVKVLKGSWPRGAIGSTNHPACAVPSACRWW